MKTKQVKRYVLSLNQEEAVDLLAIAMHRGNVINLLCQLVKLTGDERARMHDFLADVQRFLSRDWK